MALRYFNVFGPRQDPNSEYPAVIPMFIQGMMEGRELTIHGDGTQSRDFTYVSNVVEANLLAVAANGGVSGEVFNLACGSSLSLNEMVDLVAESLGVVARVTHGPSRPGDVPHSRASIDRAQAELEYQPVVSASEGLARVVRSFRA